MTEEGCIAGADIKEMKDKQCTHVLPCFLNVPTNGTHRRL